MEIWGWAMGGVPALRSLFVNDSISSDSLNHFQIHVRFRLLLETLFLHVIGRFLFACIVSMAANWRHLHVHCSEIQSEILQAEGYMMETLDCYPNAVYYL